MENSFYYFFSAVPQVLGAVLALFGVFVLFKLQSKTTEIITEASEFYQSLSRQYLNFDDDSIVVIASIFLPDLNRAIQAKSIHRLKMAMDANAQKILNYNRTFEDSVNRFYILKYEYQKLIKTTIQSSIFTACVIILCLGAIPFGKWIICESVFLYAIFAFTLISVGLIFYKLLSILRDSLS